MGRKEEKEGDTEKLRSPQRAVRKKIGKEKKENIKNEKKKTQQIISRRRGRGRRSGRRGSRKGRRRRGVNETLKLRSLSFVIKGVQNGSFEGHQAVNI